MSMKYSKYAVAALTVVLVCVMLAVVVPSEDIDAADSVPIGDYTFNLDETEHTAYLKSYLGSDADVSIPSKVEYNEEEYTVTDIGYLSFDGNTKLQSVIIPPTVKRIVQEAFDDCTNLSSVTIPEGVELIDIAAFRNCPITSITIPQSVTEIGNYAFSKTGLTSVVVPDSVTELGDGAFYMCKSLKSVTLSKNITEIKYDTFYECESLTAVQIPDGVTFIGGSAFIYCYALESVNIPNGVTTISSYAFNDCYALKSIVIPDSVTKIGQYAFEECKSMTTLTIGNGVTDIGFCAFDSCESLTSVTIPSSVKTINYTFNQCRSLKDLIFSEGLEFIGGFNNCILLETVTIPNSVTKIQSAFDGCSELTTVNIGSGLADLGEYRLFQSCPLFEKIVVSADNPNFKSVDGVMYTKDGKTLEIYPQGKADKTYSVLEGTTKISKYACYENGSIENIILPDGLTEIGDYAFYGCKSTRSMVFPSSLTTVDYGITSMTFHLESETVGQTADNLKGRTWNGNGDRNLYCFETSVFTISFMSEMTLVEEITTGKNGQLTKTMPTPENPGYVFMGWYDSIPGGNMITQDWVFTKDRNVYADWKKADVPVTGVSLDTDKVTLTLGNYTVMTANIQPSDATVRDVTWSSSDTSIFTVDEYGYVNSVSVGKATLTVTTVDGGYTAKCTVEVIGDQPSPGGGGGINAGLIIVIIIILVAGVGGFYYWKKKQQ